MPHTNVGGVGWVPEGGYGSVAEWVAARPDVPNTGFSTIGGYGRGYEDAYRKWEMLDPRRAGVS